ncbi:MAG: WG repeat-containing protein [Clostridiales bacterium]|nr:WG repeat-containing protein [Clostridiales bacterium]
MKRLFASLLAVMLMFCACAEEQDENIIRLKTDPPTYLQFNETTREWDLYDETGIIGSNYHIYYYGQEESAYLVRHKDKYGYLSLDGRWIFEPQFDDAFFFSDGIACVVVDGLLGFINIDGQYIIEPRFDDALYFNDGLCAVTEDGEKWGFIDKQGNWAIEPKYDGCYYGGFTFGTGLAVVSYSDYGERILIDKEGNELLKGTRIEFTEDDLVYVERNKYEGYYRITENGPEEVTVVKNNMYLSDYYPFEGSKVAANDYEVDFAFDGKHPLPRLDGATALLPVYAALAQAVYPDDTRYEDCGRFSNPDALFTCTKTNTAYYRLVDGETDIIFCAEPSDQQIEYAAQNGVEFEYTLFGYESFVFIVNPENPLDGLTVDQIKEIYSGELTTWDELGVEGLGEIIPYQRPKNSGSQTALEKLMGDTPITEAPQMYVSDGMEDILQTIEYRNLPNAIGYTFRFFCADMVGSKVKLLAIDGIEPTVENISNGKYPIITPLYAVTRKGESNPNVKRLLDFLTDPQGQELVEKSGYVGLGN